MTLRIDPERNEIRALRQVTSWRGKRVLEVGCGDGRLTRRLAGLSAHIQAIDPEAAQIRVARRELPRRLASRVRFRTGSAVRLEQPAETFDVVVFSWSL